MANVELTLLARVIEDNDFQKLQDNGIDLSFFKTSDGMTVYRFVRDHYMDPKHYGETPSMGLVNRYHPTLNLVAPRDSADVLIGELRRKKLAVEFDILLEDCADLAENEEFEKAIIRLADQVDEWRKRKEEDRDIVMSQAYDMIREHYEMVAAQDGLIGIPGPWDPFNEGTMGMQPGDWILLYGRPGNMKCVCEGERVLLEDGRWVPIEDVPEMARVQSFNELSRHLRYALSRRIPSGEKDCLEVCVTSGRTLRTSVDHRYRVPDGYCRAEDLKVGDWVATAAPRPDLQEFLNDTRDCRDIYLLGLLIGDGNYTRSEIQFSNVTPELRETVTALSEPYGCEAHYSPTNPDSLRLATRAGQSNPLLDRLRELGIHGQSSRDKHIPEAIFREGPKGYAAILAGLLDTDGSVNPTSRQAMVCWYTSSKRLAQEEQHLLGCLGISADMVHVPSRESWQVLVYGVSQVRAVHRLIGPFLYHPQKRRRLHDWAYTDEASNPNKDVIPHSNELENLILVEKDRTDSTWPRMGHSKFDKSKLFRRSGCISRALLRRIGEHFDSLPLLLIADQQIRWERIIRIDDIGKVRCHDICIADGGSPNFAANDFIVHNSWLANYIGTYAYERGRRVLSFQAEMTEKRSALRTSALLAGVEWDAFRKARLPPPLRDAVFTMLDNLKLNELEAAEDDHAAGFFITTGRGITNGKSVEGVRQKIEEYGPVDLVLIDGIYLLDSKGRTREERIASISNGCTDLAKDYNIPVLGVTQANREARKGRGDDVAELAFSDALGQDADLAFRVIRHYDDELKRIVLTHAWSKGRDGGVTPYSTEAKAANDFGFICSRSHKYIEYAVAKETTALEESFENEGEDVPDEQPDNSRRGRRRQPRARPRMLRRGRGRA